MGVRYLCPVCEKELKVVRKYCPHCRSLVKEPLIFKGLHLPNESDCYRSDIDYMDPRNMKKQQEHFYQHKLEMPDRPTITIGRGSKSHRLSTNATTEAVRQSVAQGRAWLQQQRSTSSGTRKTTTYNSRQSQSKNNDNGFAWKAAVVIIFLILSGC